MVERQDVVWIFRSVELALRLIAGRIWDVSEQEVF